MPGDLQPPTRPYLRPYPKIAQTTREWHIDERMARTLARAEWVITEKIHGANFCFLVTRSPDGDRDLLACAKRKALLGDDDRFYNFQMVRDRLDERIRDAATRARSEHPTCETVAIYGELFGGAYPHPDVPPDPDVELIQTGVYYAPSVEFCAFDIAVDFPASERDDDDQRLWLDFHPMRAICQAADLLCVEPLHIGTQADVMNYPLPFDSTIPARLGLPPLESDNLAEGIVARPSETLFIASKRGRTRPLIKRKIPDFSERREYHQARPWSTRPRPTAETGASGDSPLDRAERLIATLLTANRLHNALSKVGPVLGPGTGPVATPRGAPADPTWAAVHRELRDDIWQELAQEPGDGPDSPSTEDDFLARLENSERELLRDWLDAEVTALMTSQLAE